MQSCFFQTLQAAVQKRMAKPSRKPCALGFVLAACLLALSCSTTGKSSIGNADEGFVEDQPLYPTEGDDPWFFEKSKHNETFRVLITDTNYQVRQLRNKRNIQRKKDNDGDREQLTFFQKKAARMNFKDWELSGIIEVRLSPLTQQIEHIAYTIGEAPKTWQASIYFQEDLTRFQFRFPASPTYRFKVAYKWRIKKRPGLSAAEAKAMAIEYLKSQTRK